MKAYGTIAALTAGLLVTPWLLAHSWLLVIIFIGLVIALAAHQH